MRGREHRHLEAARRLRVPLLLRQGLKVAWLESPFAGEAEVIRVGTANDSETQTCDRAIAGGPPHGGQASESVRDWLEGSLMDVTSARD